MTMDASTISAVAALVVSIIAMIVASAQALEQYFMTGQLIRVCDGVVYGKMPGRGKRVWEHSQLRFRVVYSIPKISLRPNLWTDSLPQSYSILTSHQALPDLRCSVDQPENNLPYASDNSQYQQKLSSYSVTPGEASWVSFYRVAQQACECDLIYELIDCDADRCPSDLTVAPMQVSLRDTAVLALMAGMKCINASFDKQTLSMTGQAGTITSSWHPMLGATIHFAPRSYNLLSYQAEDILGLRIRGGSISEEWMARMWDVIIVAGHRYNSHDRLSYEKFGETQSRHWAMVKAPTQLRGTSRFHSPGRPFRSGSTSATRTQSKSIRHVASSSSDDANDLNIGRLAATIGKEQRYTTDIDSPVSGDDGDLRMPTYNSGRNIQPQTLAPHRYQRQEATVLGRGSLYKRVVAFYTSLSFAHLKPQKHMPMTDVEKNDTTSIPVTPPAKDQRRGELEPDKVVRRRSGSVLLEPKPKQPALQPTRDYYYPRTPRRTELDGHALKKYITESQRSPEPVSRGLLLTWHKDVDGDSGTHSDFEETGDWKMSVEQLNEYRKHLVIKKWQALIHALQRAREEQSTEYDSELESTESDLEVESYYSESVLQSNAPTQRSKGSSLVRDRSRSRERSTIRDSTFTQEGDFDSETRGRSRTPRGAEKVRQRHTSSRGTFHKNPEIAYGNKPIYALDSVNVQELDDMNILRQSGAKTQNEHGPAIQDARNETQQNNDQDTKSHPPQNSEITSKRVQILQPARQDYIEIESDSIVSENRSDDRDSIMSENSDDDRESSIERTRSTVGPSKKADTQDAKSVKFDGGFDRTSRSDRLFVVEEEQIQPTAVVPAKSILKTPKAHFPEDKYFYREGVAPLEGKQGTGIPPTARWTKISRVLVNPEALEKAQERFEERDDYVVVLRVLSREEIIKLADKTREIRAERERERYKHLREESELSGHRDEIVESPDEISDNEDIDQGHGQVPNQSNRGTDPPSRTWSQSTETNLPIPPASIPPTPMLDNNDDLVFPFRTDPLLHLHRRAASTRSLGFGTISSGSDDEDWRRSRSRSPSPSSRSRSTSRRSGSPSPSPLSRSGSLSSQSDGQDRRRSRSQSPSRVSRSRSTSRVSRSRSTSRVSRSRSTSRLPRSRSARRLSQSGDEILSNAEVDPGTKQETGNPKGVVNWFWLSQADALPGYCATPWQCNFSESTCYGAIMTMLELLKERYCTDNSTLLQYVEKQPHCQEWIYRGYSTYPSYAIRAKSGVIVERKNSPRVKLDCLSKRIPPIELLSPPEDQEKPSRTEGTTRGVVDRLGEVMGLDSWLSICARLPEIWNGDNKMIQWTPAFVQKIMIDFGPAFSELKLNRAVGGLDVVRLLAKEIHYSLEVQELLSGAEELFAIAAILRTAKMALCVIHGPDTAKLRDILIHDAQVYLV